MGGGGALTFGGGTSNSQTAVYSGAINALRVTDIGMNAYITNGPPCFVTGTRILTARGEVPVEALRVGDQAMAVLGGGLRPIRWIGHRRLDLRTHPKPEAVHPIRVSAGAFADGTPHRDLWLSPGHFVFVDGVLIQIGKLVNGATIVQVPRHEVTYWHVELDRHEVLLAEGLQVESYLDTGNRNAFANAEGFVELHPDFMPKHTTVRLKTWEIQLVIVLCNFETVGLARECRQDLALFKNRHRKDLQQCVERRLQPEPFAHDRNQHIDRNGVSCRCS